MLGISVLLHAFGFAVLLVSPAPSAVMPPSAITVELVAAAPPAPAAAPPPPPPPRPAEVVLPERPRAPKPKRLREICTIFFSP